MGIQAHAYICLLLDHGRNPGGMTVARIGQHQFVRLKAKTPNPLCAICALSRGEIETIALQRGQAQAAVNSPLASRLARFFDHRGVKQSHGTAIKTGQKLNSAILPQLLTQQSQPTVGIPQTIQQCDIGDVSNAC